MLYIRGITLPKKCIEQQINKTIYMYSNDFLLSYQYRQLVADHVLTFSYTLAFSG
jgi:hypothetical protein